MALVSMLITPAELHPAWVSLQTINDVSLYGGVSYCPKTVETAVGKRRNLG